MKQVTLSTVAAFAFCFPVLASANFVYNISFGYPGFVETGTIATTCDDSCALNSSNITAWSFFNADSGAPVAVASTDADAQILGNPVNDLIATAQGIYFNFPDTNPGNIYFSSVNGEFQLVTAGGPYGAQFPLENGYYTVCLAGNQICVLGDPVYSNQLGTLQSPPVPVPAPVWLLLSALCGLGLFPHRERGE